MIETAIQRVDQIAERVREVIPIGQAFLEDVAPTDRPFRSISGCQNKPLIVCGNAREMRPVLK